MSKIEDYTKEELLKVLLEAKSIGVGLSVKEKKLFNELPELTRSRRRTIIGTFISQDYVYVKVYKIKNNTNSSSVKMYPFITSNEDLDGISEKGIDLVNKLIKEQEDEKKLIRTEKISKLGNRIWEIILAIVVGVIVCIIAYKLGIN